MASQLHESLAIWKSLALACLAFVVPYAALLTLQVDASTAAYASCVPMLLVLFIREWGRTLPEGVAGTSFAGRVADHERSWGVRSRSEAVDEQLIRLWFDEAFQEWIKKQYAKDGLGVAAAPSTSTELKRVLASLRSFEALENDFQVAAEQSADLSAKARLLEAEEHLRAARHSVEFIERVAFEVEWVNIRKKWVPWEAIVWERRQGISIAVALGGAALLLLSGLSGSPGRAELAAAVVLVVGMLSLGAAIAVSTAMKGWPYHVTHKEGADSDHDAMLDAVIGRDKP